MDNHSDKFCSKFEFVYYSLVILKAQQVVCYGISNIRNIYPGDAKDFVTMMTGRKYPAVLNEYFKCLGTVTTKGRFPMEMETTFPNADAAQEQTDDVDYDPSVTVDDAQIDISKLNDTLNVMSTDEFEGTLQSHFTNPVFLTMSRGKPSRYRNVVYSANDPHFVMPFDYINVKLLDNVDGYLSFLSEKVRNLYFRR